MQEFLGHLVFLMCAWYVVQICDQNLYFYDHSNNRSHINDPIWYFPTKPSLDNHFQATKLGQFLFQSFWQIDTIFSFQETHASLSTTLPGKA